MAKCDFCGILIPMGTGKIFVKKDGKVINFCSNKCEKNMFKLNRKPWDIKWTESSRKARGTLK
jgi:large subunit ribosomal protein L24e